MAEEKTIYVDELAGSDETGTGVESSPVKTALKAVELGGESVKILIKKDEEGFKDISGAALKKAKKAYTELQRKLKKQEEQKKKAEEEDAKKAEEEAKALEKAKSIVLTEDEAYLLHKRSKSDNLQRAVASVSRFLAGSIVFVFRARI